jgi:transcriptional regulator with XRE-family HTH domain
MDQSANYKAQFLRRTRLARERSGCTQAEIAELLGIKQDKYKQYESRSFLPHRLVPPFCLATHVTIRWLLTGAEPEEEFPLLTKAMLEARARRQSMYDLTPELRAWYDKQRAEDKERLGPLFEALPPIWQKALAQRLSEGHKARERTLSSLGMAHEPPRQSQAAK